MVTLTPERAALLDEVARLEGKRPDLGGLVEDGARTRLARLKQATDSAQAARRRLADRVRERSLDQDPEAADRVKRLGLDG
jgi:predicted component of type VI protein secretion system